MLSLQTTRSYWMYTCPKLKLCSYWFIKGSLLRNFTKLVQKCNATLHNIHIPSLKSSKYPSSQPGMNRRAAPPPSHPHNSITAESRHATHQCNMKPVPSEKQVRSSLQQTQLTLDRLCWWCFLNTTKLILATENKYSSES